MDDYKVLRTQVFYQTREEWLAARRHFIGASETAALFGEGYADQTPVTIWESKVTGTADELDDERLQTGQDLEPGLRQIFARKMKLPCVAMPPYTVHYHPQFPWIGATLDAKTDPLVEGDEFSPVELKNVGYFNREDWEDEPPLKFQIQVQHQLAVTGTKAAYLLGLIGGNEVVIKEIRRNERFIEAMIAKINTFWRYVTTQQLPLVDGSDATSRALGRIYSKKHDGFAKLLPAEAADWAQKLEQAKAARAAADEEVTAYSNFLKAAIGEAEYGDIPGVGRYSYKVVQRPGYWVNPTTYPVLRKVKVK